MNMPKARFDHEAVTHRTGVFVSGNVHTQTIDGFWSLLKGGIRGGLPQRFTEAPAGLPERVRLAVQPPGPGRSVVSESDPESCTSLTSCIIRLKVTVNLYTEIADTDIGFIMAPAHL